MTKPEIFEEGILDRSVNIQAILIYIYIYDTTELIVLNKQTAYIFAKSVSY